MDRFSVTSSIYLWQVFVDRNNIFRCNPFSSLTFLRWKKVQALEIACFRQHNLKSYPFLEDINFNVFRSNCICPKNTLKCIWYRWKTSYSIKLQLHFTPFSFENFMEVLVKPNILSHEKTIPRVLQDSCLKSEYCNKRNFPEKVGWISMRIFIKEMLRFHARLAMKYSPQITRCT